jgi:transcription initiation factor TFIID subunit 11
MSEPTSTGVDKLKDSDDTLKADLETDLSQNRPASTVSSIASKSLAVETEDVSQLESPNSPVPAEEEDEEEEDNGAGYEESAERDEIIRERINRTQEQMRLIVDNLSEEQLKRYERFRRVGLARPTMEKLMQRILDQKVNSTSVIVTAGIAKVFVGELIEGARAVMEEEIRAQLELSILDPDVLEETVISTMEQRALEPFHIIESHRRMKFDQFSAPHSLLYSKPSPF